MKTPLKTAQIMFLDIAESFAMRVGRQYPVYDIWQHKPMALLILLQALSKLCPEHGCLFLLNLLRYLDR